MTGVQTCALPIFQFADGVTREHATYEGEIIKQADVNLLSFPLQVIREEERMRKDLAYYEKVMDPREIGRASCRERV